MADAYSVKIMFYGQEVEVFLTREQYDLIKDPGEDFSLAEPPPKKERYTMSNTLPQRPTEVEAGQVWRDRDERTTGSGEFEVLEVVERKYFGHRRQGTAPHAKVKRLATSRTTHIEVERLLHQKGRTGYDYLGKKKR